MINFYNLYLNNTEAIDIRKEYFPLDTSVPFMAIVNFNRTTAEHRIEYLTSTSSVETALDYLAPLFPGGSIKYIYEDNFMENMHTGVQSYKALL